MDECDVSDLRMEKENEFRIKNHRYMMANKSVSKDCVECGDTIPKERQEASGGTDVCIDCARFRERGLL